MIESGKFMTNRENLKKLVRTATNSIFQCL
jgi:hypothetical protein